MSARINLQTTFDVLCVKVAKNLGGHFTSIYKVEIYLDYMNGTSILCYIRISV